MKAGSVAIVFILAMSFVGVGWAAEPLKIAAVFPKSGSAVTMYEQIGHPAMQGVRFAVAELNTRGGLLGRPVELIELDNESTILGSRQAAEKAVSLKVTAVIGAAWSSHSLAMAPVLQQARIPQITPLATSPDVTKAGDYIFRVCYTDNIQGDLLAMFAHQDLKAKRAVVLVNTGDRYSSGLASFFIARTKKLGGVVLAQEDYNSEATDFLPLLRKVQALKPDIIFVPGTQRDAGYIIRQARGFGIKTLFLGGDGWNEGMYRYGGETIEGNYYCTHWHMQSDNPRSRRFVKAFQKTHAGDIIPGTALAYDAVMLLADAIQRAGSSEGAKVRDALAATQSFPGVSGKITFDRDRNPIHKAAVIMRFERGQAVYVKTFQP